MIYFCCDNLRRNAVRGLTDINGIDFLEVVDNDAPSEDLRQRLLQVYLLNPHSGDDFTADNFRVEGGERISNINVTDVTMGIGDQANVVTLEVDRAGDFSQYRLCLLRSNLNHDTRPPPGFDPMLVNIEFWFKVECPSDFDCKPQRICPPEQSATPPIDYLAKDYASFRNLMLDRMSALVPDWHERHAADIGIATLEALAYTADHLSYEQDALNSEAYLGTARRRISARRHARLVDYQIDDGSNARCWVQVQSAVDIPSPGIGLPVIPAGTQLFTQIQGQTVLLPNDPIVLAKAEAVFETMVDLEALFVTHNEMHFYTWSDNRCCLPAGALSATLAGHFPNLTARNEELDIPGSVLVFEEKRGANTGSESDANPSQRHAVLLTGVRSFDDQNQPLRDPVTQELVTEIEWGPADALPTAYCVSAIVEQGGGSEVFDDISVARGNVVLADHGQSVEEPEWAAVPDSTLQYLSPPKNSRCDDTQANPIPVRFAPNLLFAPLTHAAPLADKPQSAWSQMNWPARDARPQIILASNQVGETDWQPQADLLNSRDNDEHFVVEIEANGEVALRFGNDDKGKRPNAGTIFVARYRIGNGSPGNIGVDSLAHILIGIDQITAVRNLTPGTGGTEPETIEDVQQNAPHAFRTQERAVTAADYEEKMALHPLVQQAAATPRWTGSWYTWFLTIDRIGGAQVDEEFEADIREYAEKYRLAGYDLEVDGPIFVPLEIDMFVCVNAEYFRSDVKQELLEVFSDRRLPDNKLGEFHPDNFSFGQAVYLSPLYSAAHAVDGVESVEISKFKRQRSTDNRAIDTGVLPVNRLEIAQLANDRNFPERGVFRLAMGGGK